MNKYEAYVKLKTLGLSEESLNKCLVDMSLMSSEPEIDRYVEKLSSDSIKEFAETMKSKPFYKSINSDSINEQLKGMSSFLTHVVIQKLNNSNFDLPCVKEAWQSLGDFLFKDDTTNVSESCKSILEDLKGGNSDGHK